MKTQMKFQKILALVTLISAAIAAVIGLIFCSGLLNAIRQYSDYADRIDIGANALYEYSQGINNTVLVMAIILIVAAVLLYIFGCNKMRNYYVSNYVAIGIYVVYAVVFAIFMFIVCFTCIGLKGQIDFEMWKAYEAQTNAEGELIRPQYYSDSIATIVFGILIAIVVLAEAGLWVYNLIWKLKLMKGEKELLAKGAISESEQMEVA
ncbi:MAG: hypothetical protein ACI4QN_02090 [Candidatus Coproplasma sp.]